MEKSNITYLRRFNLGNYEHEEFSISSTVEYGGELNEALRIKLVVLKASGTQPAEEEEDPQLPLFPPEPEAEPAPRKKRQTKAKPPIAKVEVEDPKPHVEEESKVEPEVVYVSEPVEVAPKAAPEVPQPEPTPPPPKVKKPILGAYDRKNDVHKKLLGEALDQIAPNWRKTLPLVSEAKVASVELEGKPFLDESGKVLSEVIQELKERMKSVKLTN